MTRHTSFGCVAAAVFAGMAAGAAAVYLMSDPKSMRNAKRCAQRKLHSLEDLLEEVKDRLM